jgi:hypothetical protein
VVGRGEEEKRDRDPINCNSLEREGEIRGVLWVAEN